MSLCVFLCSNRKVRKSRFELCLWFDSKKCCTFVFRKVLIVYFGDWCAYFISLGLIFCFFECMKYFCWLWFEIFLVAIWCLPVAICLNAICQKKYCDLDFSEGQICLIRELRFDYCGLSIAVCFLRFDYFNRLRFGTCGLILRFDKLKTKYCDLLRRNSVKKFSWLRFD